MLYPDNETKVCPCLFITANERLQTLTIWGGLGLLKVCSDHWFRIN